MTTNGRSLTAEGVAVYRAAHQFIDHEPLVFRDPLARRVIGDHAATWLQANLPALKTEHMRRIRGMVTVRSRFCEDELRRVAAQDHWQYVLLGAGLDTFAYRSADLAGRLTIFEVDHPATQDWKLDRLREGDIAVPGNVRFVPVDFNDEAALPDALAAAGFDRDRPAFFAWLGVSYYLPGQSVWSMLRFIAGQRAACHVVFDFAVDASAVPEEFQHLFRDLRRHMTNSAEPWQTWLVPQELIAELRELGFADIVHLDAPSIRRRYLQDRTDGLLPGPLVALISAGRPGRQQSPPGKPAG